MDKNSAYSLLNCILSILLHNFETFSMFICLLSELGPIIFIACADLISLKNFKNLVLGNAIPLSLIKIINVSLKV